jgi:hypothetical protein
MDQAIDQGCCEPRGDEALKWEVLCQFRSRFDGSRGPEWLQGALGVVLSLAWLGLGGTASLGSATEGRAVTEIAGQNVSGVCTGVPTPDSRVVGTKPGVQELLHGFAGIDSVCNKSSGRTWASPSRCVVTSRCGHSGSMIGPLELLPVLLGGRCWPQPWRDEKLPLPTACTGKDGLLCRTLARCDESEDCVPQTGFSSAGTGVPASGGDRIACKAVCMTMRSMLSLDMACAVPASPACPSLPSPRPIQLFSWSPKLLSSPGCAQAAVSAATSSELPSAPTATGPTLHPENPPATVPTVLKEEGRVGSLSTELPLSELYSESPVQLHTPPLSRKMRKWSTLKCSASASKCSARTVFAPQFCTSARLVDHSVLWKNQAQVGA